MPRSKVFLSNTLSGMIFFVTCSQSRPIYCGPVGILCLPSFHQFCTKLQKPQIISSNHGKTDEVRAGFSLILSVTSIHDVPALTSNKCIDTSLGVNTCHCAFSESVCQQAARPLAGEKPSRRNFNEGRTTLSNPFFSIQKRLSSHSNEKRFNRTMKGKMTKNHPCQILSIKKKQAKMK